MRALDPATYPPAAPKDLVNVPIRMSTFGATRGTALAEEKERKVGEIGEVGDVGRTHGAEGSMLK